MSEIDVGVMVRADGGEWKRLSRELDEMNDPAVMAVQRQFELEANRVRTRLRLEQVDGRDEEEASNRAHVHDQLEDMDRFTKEMIALGSESTDA